MTGLQQGGHASTGCMQCDGAHMSLSKQIEVFHECVFIEIGCQNLKREGCFFLFFFKKMVAVVNIKRG